MKLYKYRNFESHTENNIPLYELIIKDSSLYFASIISFNDPFDCQLSFKDTYTESEIKRFCREKAKKSNFSREQKEKLIEKTKDNDAFYKFAKGISNQQIEEIGILSLSANCNNILMWSHYSDSHRGLVFEFEPKYEDCFLKPFGPIAVDYKETYKVLSHAVTDENIRKKQFEELILTKYIDWEYENEYRVIDLKHIGSKRFRKDELTSIIFGLNTTKENIDKVKKLCKENGFEHVKFKQTVKIKGRFELEIIDI